MSSAVAVNPLRHRGEAYCRIKEAARKFLEADSRWLDEPEDENRRAAAFLALGGLVGQVMFDHLRVHGDSRAP